MPNTCSMLHWLDEDPGPHTMEDYAGPVARWCPGCGDHSVLTQVQKLLAARNMAPEETVFVSGIGCSSRFPHYLKTYGFHGIHGRALPVATGVKLHRPELNVFVVMGDGDCTSIGAGHWLHATRYNMDMVALMLDNHIYGLTKKQTSPTTPQGYASNTQPRGSYLPALNPLEAALGITNVSFVAQTIEWMPAHLYETLEAAYDHRGFAFVRILQRCPQYTTPLFQDIVKDPGRIQVMHHANGVDPEPLKKLFKDRIEHDPSDLNEGRRLAAEEDVLRIGVFYRNDDLPIYEETRHETPHTVEEKLQLLDQEFDSYAV